VMDFLETPPPSSPLRAAARFWPVTAILIALGLAAGLAAAAKHAPTYTAEARLAVGGQNLSSQAIPGFVQASQALAADYARYVSLPQQADALQKGLGGNATAVISLSASPVPSSNIISIEATSHLPSTAVAAAKVAMTALMTAVNDPAKATIVPALLTQYQAMSTEVAQADVDLQTAKQQLAVLIAGKSPKDAALAAARAAIVAASSRLDSLTLQRSALGNRYQEAATSTAPSSDLTIVQPASVIFDNKRSNQDKFALAGAAAGLVVALAMATLIARLRPRRPGREGHHHRNDDAGRARRDGAESAGTIPADETASAPDAVRVGDPGRA
jgi:hypothetical protein